MESSVCTFWNFRADRERGNWSTEGCKFVSITSDGLISCECTHLTNFAVLMNIFYHDSLTESQLRILEVTTYFGCGASILGLFITIAAFLLHKCFLNYPWVTLCGVAVPLSILIVFNIVIYAMIIYKLNKRLPGRHRSDNSKSPERLKQFQNAVSIFLLLGVTWGLGYVCFIPTGQVFSFVFQLLFVIFNSMQGYLIFMLYGMRNPLFRRKWRKLCLFCPNTAIQTSLVETISSSKEHYSVSKNENISNSFLPSTFPISSPERRRIDSVEN
ncbi:Adhesion G protein-coupled receptor E4 [Holothuria leucospilota]|uniref:Adhesion G protein-coupled receptor E4 n=1 Tax=Holothuria leucospilota TaxID=206669 RepID=A0A9Q1C149_HOLLE|nr:Adhesion G protein-coupled receptor E4 [Holothuria leucospilota]